MKKKFSTGKILIFFCILYVIVISSAFLSGIKIDSSFYSILPAVKDMEPAEKKLVGNTSALVNIFIGSPNLEEAESLAVSFYEHFQNSTIFQNINLCSEEDSVDSIRNFLFENRYFMLDNKTIKSIENGEVEQVCLNRLNKIFSPFTLSDLGKLKDDPFLLSEERLAGYLSMVSGNIKPQDRFMVGKYGDKYYVMIRGKLSPAAISFSKDNGVRQIYKKCNEMKIKYPDSDIVFSGVPFHSFESSEKARNEMAWIGAVSLAGVLILLICTFHSVSTVIVSVGNILLSLLFAASSAVLFFGEIHVLVLVFGSTLIGMSIDYSIHFFMVAGEAKNYRGLIINCISTEISWLLLLFAPFQLLREIAVFSATGLFSSFIMVVICYPALKFKLEEKIYMKNKKKTLPFKKKYVLIPLAFIVLLPVVFISDGGIKIKNNLSNMYRMSDFLAKSEKTAMAIMDSGYTGNWIIVNGENQEKLLSNEEKVVEILEKERKAGNLGGYTAISTFIPSLRTQKRSYAAAGALLPYVASQLSILGLDTSAENRIYVDYKTKEQDFIFCNTILPHAIQEVVNNLYLGKIDGKYYSVIFPTNINNIAAIEASLGSVDFCKLNSKVNNISSQLDSLTKITMFFIFVSYCLISVILVLVYRKKSCFILLLLLLIIAGTMSFISGINNGIDFFSAAGFILVFGLGLDYLVYVLEGKIIKKVNAVGWATFLSFLTTEFSFGILVLSSFPPVHSFGLAVSVGLGLSYLLSFMVLKIDSDKS